MTTETNETPIIDDQAATGEVVEQEAVETTEAEGDQPETEEAPKPNDKIAKRFSEMTAKIRQAEQRAAEAEARAAAYEATAYGEDDAAEPDVAALVRQELAQQAERQATEAKVTGLVKTLIDSGLEGAMLIASGDQSIPFSQTMVNIAAEMPEAPQVADYLAKNPMEAWQIAQMPPAVAKAAMGKIAASVAPSVKVSNAPEPATSIKTSGFTGSGLSDNLPIDEWMRRERASRQAR